MSNALAIAAGGALGALARYGLSGLVHRLFGGTFPLGTLIVNVLGCLAIGALAWAVEERGLFGPGTRLFLRIGILGSFTTFSTFGHETFAYLREGDPARAAANVLANVLIGMLAVWLGWVGARASGL